MFYKQNRGAGQLVCAAGSFRWADIGSSGKVYCHAAGCYAPPTEANVSQTSEVLLSNRSNTPLTPPQMETRERFCYNCGAELAHGSAYCGKCGFPVNSAEKTTAMPPQAAMITPKKRGSSKGKKALLIASAATAVILSAVCVVIFVINRTPKFELLADGTLYCENISSTIEIPREFDGQAYGFDGNYRGCDLKYDGSLRHFLKFYSWILYDRDSARKVYCNDFRLFISDYGGDGVEPYYPPEGGVYLIYVNYTVLRGNETIRSFESAYDLREWLDLSS